MLPAQLIAWRVAGVMSREAAAKLLGCSTKSLERYESGKRPIPDEIAAAALAMGKTDAGIDLAPPIALGETPWTHPHLYRRAPGKKDRWDRIDPGKPIMTANDVGWYPTVKVQRLAEAEAQRAALLKEE